MKNFLKILAIFFVNSFMIAILMLILALVINFSFVQIGKTIDSNHHREVQTVKKATDKVCRRYMRNGQMYSAYHSCSKCKNASWYDDNYCNNQKIHFIEKEDVKTTRVYCENYEQE